MTVHFYYKYKEDLLKQLQRHYEKELKDLEVRRAQQLQLDEAERIIRNYYKDLKQAYADIAEASKGEVRYEEGDGYILMLTIHRNYLKFVRTENAIEVMVGRYRSEEDLVEGEIESYIVPGDKRCVLRKPGSIHQGSHFDSETIDHYMRETFSHQA